MRTNTQRQKYQFPLHVDSCWSRGWHLTNRQMIAGTAVCVKRCHYKRQSWCHRCGHDKKVVERKALEMQIGIVALDLRASIHRSPEVFRQNAWWHQPKSLEDCKIVESFRLRTCLAPLMMAHGTDCNPSLIDLVSYQRALAPKP